MTVVLVASGSIARGRLCVVGCVIGGCGEVCVGNVESATVSFM